MAGLSWVQFLGDPSWSKVPELILDTASLFPLVSNLKGVTKADEAWKIIQNASKNDYRIKDKIKK